MLGPERFSVELEPDRDLIRIKPYGDLDLGSHDALGHELDELREAGFRHLVLDLRRVEFMDSTGLGVIVAAAKKFRGVGGRLELKNARGQVRRLLELTCLHDQPWLDDSQGE